MDQLTNKEKISKINEKSIVPVSDYQRSIWILSQMGKSQLYHVAKYWKTDTSIDAEIFNLAIDELVRRHEILRTTFTSKMGTLFQIIHDFIKPGLVISEAYDQHSILKQFTDTAFDLEKGSLVRFLLSGNEETGYIIGFSFHHIVTDGWSINILMDELQIFYERLLKGEEITHPNDRLQYADYSLWSEKNYDDESNKPVLNRLKQKLNGLQRLNLINDHSSNKFFTGDGGFLSQKLDGELSVLIAAFAKKHNVTRFKVFFAIVYQFLSKLGRQPDVCIGLPYGNRGVPETRNIVGFFVNSLPIRINPSDNELNFEDLVKLVDFEITEGKKSQHLPFYKIIEHVSEARRGAENPFFNVQVNFVPPAKKQDEKRFFAPEKFPFHNDTAKFDLTFDYSEKEDGSIVYSIEYSTDLYIRETIQSYLHYLISITRRLIQSSDLPINTVQLFDVEKNEKEDNQSHKSQTNSSLGLHQLVEQQATLTPHHTALTMGGKSIDYKSLIEQVELWSYELRKRGVCKGDIVGVLADRSFEMVISFLAILKTGAAYLSVSKEIPVDRISYMLRDSGSKYLITDIAESDLLKELKQETNLPESAIISTDIDLTESEKPDLQQEMKPERSDPAYLIYTSGSTGNPKGVLISHEAIVNHMSWMRRQFSWNSHDIFIQKTATSFDASVWEFYLPLVIGNQLVLSETGDQTDSDTLIKEIKEYQVTVLQGTPTLLEYLSDINDFKECQTLNWIFSGGEALPSKLAKKLKNDVNCTVVNLYGPTECTVDASFHIYEEQRDQNMIVPIGSAIDHMTPMILDEQLFEMPAGIPGELCFSGKGLAIGYINNKILTDQYFVKKPAYPSQRIYKTGDLAVVNQKGVISYLGRKDKQLKIRGVRIEAGEIETIISSIEEIVQVAVVLSGNSLVAYYKSTVLLNSQQLRDHASKKLPVYMIPAYFIRLDQLPITVSGKINRNALELREIQVKQREIIHPENDLEKSIYSIWCQALDVKNISVTDNFFEMGGHSLVGMQILSKINNLLHLSITLKQLFEATNIRALSNLIDSLKNQSDYLEVEDIVSSYGEDSQELIL